MNRRVVLAFLVVALVSAGPFGSVTAQSAPRANAADDVTYDLANVRAAMARGARSVGDPPAEAAKYMRDKPLGWRHSVEPVTLEQPDGSTLRARGLEIEEGGGQATLDGYLVTQTDDGWWHYGARRSNGRIKPLDAIPGRDGAPRAASARRMPTAFKNQIAEFAKNAGQLEQFMSSQAMAEAAAAATAAEPVVFRVPTLMLRIHNDEWQDQSTPEFFEKQLSGTGGSKTGTVTELYLEQSFGKMVVEIDVYGPYDSATNVVSPDPNCHYGTDGAPITGDTLGLGGGGAAGMAAEAVPMADPDVNFGDYDNDGDGVVDFLMVLHSGPDAAATGDPCHVWSHYFGPVVSDPAYNPIALTTDQNSEGEPVYVGPTLTVPEVDLQIGVTAHEIMHALGEPDYYGTAGTVGTGDWDLGAGASWAGIPTQTNPVHFNPVMKMNFGWVKPRVIEATSLGEALRPRAKYPDLLQVPLRVAEAGSEESELCNKAPVGIPSQNNAFYTEDGDCLVEGFLIENVNNAAAKWNDCLFQPADFDRQLYGSGLMVWHWDFVNYESLGNDNVLRPMLDIEEFDRRDGRQELGTGITRAQPLDAFWGDPVGISGATQLVPQGGAIESPADSPWTVTGPPGGGAVEATPMPEWETPAAPEGTGMVVKLEWDSPADDWDLGLDKWVDGEWVEVGTSAGGPPSNSEELTVFDFVAGDRYRARAYNFLAAVPQARLSVDYSTAGLTQFGPAGTRNNDLEQTGWQITNIRPNDYNGLAHQAALPRTPIQVDVIKHDDTTVDVSGDFLHRSNDAIAPFVAGEEVSLATNVYNHGGKAVNNATFELYDGDPAAGGDLVATRTVDLAGYERTAVDFPYTPALGRNDLYVVADAAGDLVAGNNIVHTQLEAYPGDSDVLIVDNDFGWAFEEDYEATLNSLGVSYDIVEGEPDTDVLSRYDAVIWITTTVSGDQGVISDDAVEYITDYLDGGGKLWLASTRAAGYLTTRAAEWLAGYFGLQVEQNLLNSPGIATGLGGPVGGEREIQLGYMDGKAYIDYGPMAAEADVKGTATALFTHEDIPVDAEGPAEVIATSVQGADDAGSFRTVYGLPINLVQDPAERVKLTEEILGFFDVETGSTPPQDLAVRFNRFQLVQNGQDWRVTVGAVAADGIDKVELVHRPYGTKAWRALSLARETDGIFSGVIPGGQIPNNGLEYFARVTSGGDVIEIDGGSKLPNVATAPYGDSVQDEKCQGNPPDGDTDPDDGIQPDDNDRGPGGGSGQAPADDARDRDRPVLPATGLRSGLTLGALLLLVGLSGLSKLRRRT